MDDLINYRAIGKRIRQHRVRAKITQQMLAKKISLSASFLGHIERGTRICSVETLARIARTFGCSIDVLVYGTEKPVDPNDLREVLRYRIATVLCEHYSEWLPENVSVI